MLVSMMISEIESPPVPMRTIGEQEAMTEASLQEGIVCHRQKTALKEILLEQSKVEVVDSLLTINDRMELPPYRHNIVDDRIRFFGQLDLLVIDNE